MAGFLITRPEGDSQETARRIRALGHEAVISALINIRKIDGPPVGLVGVQALLATSANGIRAFVRRQGGPVPGLKVFAVGNATARTAENFGMDDVISADGDVDDLARLVGERLSPNEGDLLHVAGTKVAGDLAAKVADAGFSYRREVLYEAQTAEELPETARAGIASGTIAAVLMYSPRTARRFDDLVSQAGLREACANLSAVCLSCNVADVIGRPWRQVFTAAAPTEDDLMTLIKENFASST